MAPPLDDQTNHAAAIAPEVELAPSVAPDLHKVPSLAHTTPAPVSEPEQVKSAVAPTPKKKRVAIVGGGTAGLGNLISLLSLPESVRQGWQIDLFEQREDVGGIWLSERETPPYPQLPLTPLYADLHTNTPVPTMTFPYHHFPADTELFPSYTAVADYLRSAVEHFNLAPHIQLNSSLESATFSTADKSWSLDIKSGNSRRTAEYDHLIVASGRYHHPSIPEWNGQADWIAAGGGKREILHSLWYRGSEKFAGRTIVVVGFSASGWDMATLSVPHGSVVYHSYEDHIESPFRLAPLQGVVQKPRISHFTADSIVFTDGTTVESDDAVILLGTGFNLLAPFLTRLTVGPHSKDSPSDHLTTNKKYIRPLHQEIFSLDPQLPTNALAFSGLVWYIGVAQNSIAQGLYIAHAIANDEFLAPREELVKELAEYEAEQRAKGFEPYDAGHRFTAIGDAELYQNNLLKLVRTKSSIPVPSYLVDPAQEGFVQEWRYWGRGKGFFLRKGFRRAKEQGLAHKFLPKDSSEEAWIQVMKDLIEWETEQDKIEPWELTR